MSILDKIVNIRITKPNSSLRATNFGTLLIIGESNKKIRVKKYSEISEVAKDYDTSTDEYKAATLAFGQSAKIDNILIGQLFDEESYAEAYLAIAKENNDFYGVVITSKEAEDQISISELVETQRKIFGLSMDDPKMLDEKDTSNILHQLNALGRKRTFVIYNTSSTEETYPEAAWFGLMFTKPPGGATWGYKQLSGFKADYISDNDASTLNSKNGNYFCSFAGVDIMLTGKMANGEWIDTVRGLDWLDNHLKVQVGNALVSSEKIAFTNSGATIIESAIFFALKDAANMGIIDKDSIEVSVPDVRSLAESIKLKRILPNVTFKATLVGAIHTVEIRGSLSN
jgi:hypothetical protein